MKLLNKTTQYYLLLSIPIILISMLTIFYLIRFFNLKHVDKSLKKEHLEIISKANNIKQYFIEDELSDELLVFEINTDSIIYENFSTVTLFDSIENDYKPFRQLETTQSIAGRKYLIQIRKSFVENSTLIYSISISIFIMLIVLLTAFLYLNRFLSKKMWMPFYNILKSLEEYSVGKEYLKIEHTKIEEFKNLNESIIAMTNRINKDFFIYKEFIDIVSHEYQTPLAVISNKAELLFQNQMLKNEDYEYLNGIIENVIKLKNINKSLLLLSRIDNNQFEATEEISVKTMIKQLLVEKQHQIEHKEIDVKLAFEDDVVLSINLILCEILFGNLLQNAIRHNLKSGGRIICEVRKGNFHIYNTGIQSKKMDKKIFAKFFKNSNSSDSIGLGLSIVKSICDLYGYSVYYEYLEEREEHHFLLRF